MRLRPALIAKPAGMGTFPLMGDGNYTDEQDPATNFPLGFADSIGSPEHDVSGGVESTRRYAWYLFRQPLKEPLIKLLNANPGSIYSGSSSFNANAPISKDVQAKLGFHAITTLWDKTTLCWNNQPAFSATAGLNVYSKLTGPGQDAVSSWGPCLVLDCRGTGELVVGLALTFEIINGADGELAYGAVNPPSPQLLLPAGARLNSIGITNRASNHFVRTLTTATPHGLDVGSWVLITGIDCTPASTYNPQDAFKNPQWVQIQAIPAPTATEFSYTYDGTDLTEGVASAGQVRFFPNA